MVETNKTRPNHYGGDANPFEPIKIIEYYDLNFCIGNSLKYVLRAGKKEQEELIDDYKKAAWYLMREIKRLESGSKNSTGKTSGSE